MKAIFKQPIKKTLLSASLIALALPVLAASPFTPADQKQIDAYKHQFESVKNQAQLVAAYRQTKKLEQALGPSLEKYMIALKDELPSDAELNAISKQMPGLKAVLAAEATVIALQQDFAAYGKLAAKTPEPADNAFFDLMKQAYGSEFHFFGNWFTQTWDYGGCTRLGSGTHTKLFQGIQRLRTAKSPFAPELKEFEDELLFDLTNTFNFCQPHAKVVSEYKQVLPLTPAAIRPKLQKRLQQIQSKAKDLYFDCDKPNSSCNYG